MKKIVFTFLLVFVSQFAFAQKDSIIIQGYVKDTTTGELIPFTEIVFDTLTGAHKDMGGIYATRTDFDGYFKIKIPKSMLPAKHKALYFKNIGYAFSPILLDRNSYKKKIIAFGKAVLSQSQGEMQPIDPIKKID